MQVREFTKLNLLNNHLWKGSLLISFKNVKLQNKKSKYFKKLHQLLYLNDIKQHL
jgi:hypothetical protein